jgi:hypothetical protein
LGEPGCLRVIAFHLEILRSTASRTGLDVKATCFRCQNDQFYMSKRPVWGQVGGKCARMLTSNYLAWARGVEQGG